MLDPTEILDLQHCRRVDPTWAKLKAGHYLVDASACDERVAEYTQFALSTPREDYREQNWASVKSYRDMAQRYRARARILLGGEL